MDGRATTVPVAAEARATAPNERNQNARIPPAPRGTKALRGTIVENRRAPVSRNPVTRRASLPTSPHRTESQSDSRQKKTPQAKDRPTPPAKHPSPPFFQDARWRWRSRQSRPP